MKSLSATLCVVTVAFLAGQAKAQCPAGVTPLNFIANTSWAFETHDGLEDASVGVFTASVGTSRAGTTPVGLLNITQTSDLTSQILSQANFAGGYTIAADCSGGSLTFNQGGNGYIFGFVFVKGGSEMLFLNQSSVGQNTTIHQFIGVTHGRAKLLPAAPSCAAGTNPLNVLNGTTWGFETETEQTVWVGTFSASVIASGRGAGGSLSVTESFTGLGNGLTPTIINQDQVGGSFVINSDCSGGQLIFATSGEAGMGGGMYAFVFASPTQMYLVANSNTVPSSGGNLFSILAAHGDAYVR